MQKGLELRPLGNTGEQVTFIGFGALEIGRNWGLGDEITNQRPDEAAAIEVLNGVLDLGINLIDTASAYHQSEARIGKGLRARRAEYFLASKCGEHNSEPSTFYDFRYPAVKNSIDRSLKLLQTDQIDLMQIHFGPDPQKVLDDGETVRAMQDARQEGKIRFLGASASGNIAAQCIDSGVFQVLQLEYSLLNRTDENLVQRCRENGIGVLIRGGLARGMLTRKANQYLKTFPESIRPKVSALLELVGHDGDRLMGLALYFLYKNPGVSSVLVGTKNPDHLRANFQMLEVDFENEYRRALEITAH